MPDSKSKKSIVFDYLFQAFMIVFSVLLALYLNGYSNEITERRELKLALNNIVQETQSNKQIVSELVKYHLQVCQNLEKILMSSTKLDTFRTEFGLSLSKIASQGVMQQIPSQAAWETSKLNNTIVRLDFKSLKLLSRTYDQQAITFAPAQKILDIITTPNGNIRETLAILNVYFSELRGRESQLLIYYDEVLTEFKNQR